MYQRHFSSAPASERVSGGHEQWTELIVGMPCVSFKDQFPGKVLFDGVCLCPCANQNSKKTKPQGGWLISFFCSPRCPGEHERPWSELVFGLFFICVCTYMFGRVHKLVCVHTRMHVCRGHSTISVAQVSFLRYHIPPFVWIQSGSLVDPELSNCDKLAVQPAPETCLS